MFYIYGFTFLICFTHGFHIVCNAQALYCEAVGLFQSIFIVPGPDNVVTFVFMVKRIYSFFSVGR